MITLEVENRLISCVLCNLKNTMISYWEREEFTNIKILLYRKYYINRHVKKNNFPQLK